jgi:hypothetical protein
MKIKLKLKNKKDHIGLEISGSPRVGGPRTLKGDCVYI